MDEIVEWLLKGEPWVEYRTRVDLLGQNENQKEVALSKQKMISHPKIQSLLFELKNWPGKVISSHKSASQPFHKLSFIADIGLKRDDPYIEEIAQKIFDHQSAEGPFQLPMNIPKHFGGSGTDQWAWALCDAPILVYSLAKFGFGYDERVQKAVKYLGGIVRDNGWPCAVSKELGKFRGPGKKSEPCPYATLVMLKMLLHFEEWKQSKEAHLGAESLLDLWSKSRELHPYMFYMGTDFRKLKVPFIWYDILHVLDVLSFCTWLKDDSRLKVMVQIVKDKVKDGKYTPESEWTAWKDWDLGKKKLHSRWLTLLIMRILKRME